MGEWGNSAWGNEGWESGTALVPVKDRNEFTEADIRFDCAGEDNQGNPFKGVIVISLSMTPSAFFHESDTITISITPAGIFPGDYVSTVSTITISVLVSDRGGDVAVDLGPDSGLIWTSRIGALDFDEHISGETVRMPMEHSGVINKIMKLGDSAIVYADRGVTRLTPVGVNWRRVVLHEVGTMSKDAATGTDDVHYFLDKIGIMYKLLPNALPEMLDYSQLMSSMNSNTVMSYDVRRDTVYITDGTLGYALTEGGLGECPPTISGVGWKAGSFYSVSPSAITNSPVEITTDIVDFGSRYQKTISSLLIGLFTSNDVYVAVDYRQKKSDSWSSTDWRRVDDEGVTSFTVTAVEFRFKLKLTTYEDIQLDYFTAVGKFIHGADVSRSESVGQGVSQ